MDYCLHNHIPFPLFQRNGMDINSWHTINLTDRVCRHEVYLIKLQGYQADDKIIMKNFNAKFCIKPRTNLS